MKERITQLENGMIGFSERDIYLLKESLSKKYNKTPEEIRLEKKLIEIASSIQLEKALRGHKILFYARYDSVLAWADNLIRYEEYPVIRENKDTYTIVDNNFNFIDVHKTKFRSSEYPKLKKLSSTKVNQTKKTSPTGRKRGLKFAYNLRRTFAKKLKLKLKLYALKRRVQVSND